MLSCLHCCNRLRLWFRVASSEVAGPPCRSRPWAEDEVACLEAHICGHFGKFSGVFHERISPDIHVDIVIIEPTSERDYWVLVTMGMGARPMNVPPELAEYRLERAEVMLCLPHAWDLENQAEEWYWPLRWLKILARLPGDCNTWLGWGHTVPAGRPLAENTALCGMLLVNPGAFDVAAYECALPGGETVLFYQAVPLYAEEIQYKLDYGAEALLELMPEDMLEYIRIDRENACQAG